MTMNSTSPKTDIAAINEAMTSIITRAQGRSRNVPTAVTIPTTAATAVSVAPAIMDAVSGRGAGVGTNKDAMANAESSRMRVLPSIATTALAVTAMGRWGTLDKIGVGIVARSYQSRNKSGQLTAISCQAYSAPSNSYAIANSMRLLPQ